MRTILGAGLLGCALSAPAAEPSTPIPLDPARWELSGDAKIETYLGRPALRMCNAEVHVKDVQFLDGTLDFDLAVSTRRNFPMVGLRRQGEGEYEEFYLRTHKSELPDAIQYVPAYQGVGGWQLYHGPGFTAKAEFPRNQWFPVRIVLSGTRAAVFVGDVAEPQLVVVRLRREPRAGGLEFADACPKGSVPEGERVAAISNVVLRPGYVPYDFAKSTTRENEPPTGVIPEWEISESFVPEKGPVRSLPEKILRGQWQRVAAEPSGLVVLEKHVPLPKGRRATGRPRPRRRRLARRACAPFRLRLQRRGHRLPERPASLLRRRALQPRQPAPGRTDRLLAGDALPAAPEGPERARPLRWPRSSAGGA